MREKNAVKRLVNLEDKKPFVYASGRYANEFNKTTVAFPIAPGRNRNVLVFDLRYNLEEVLEQGLRESKSVVQPESRQAPRAKRSPESPAPETFYPIIKELCYNKCPAVAPMSVLDRDDGWAKIELKREDVEKNLAELLRHPEFAEQIREEYENRSDFPPALEPEAALYDGFLNDADRVKVSAVRNAEPSKLADFHPDFIDERLPELLLHYKGRNHPECLSESEAEQYEAYRRKRLERQAPKFIDELEKIQDDFLKEELILYLQSLQ